MGKGKKKKVKKGAADDDDFFDRDVGDILAELEELKKEDEAAKPGEAESAPVEPWMKPKQEQPAADAAKPAEPVSEEQDAPVEATETAPAPAAKSKKDKKKDKKKAKKKAQQAAAKDPAVEPKEEVVVDAASESHPVEESQNVVQPEDQKEDDAGDEATGPKSKKDKKKDKKKKKKDKEKEKSKEKKGGGSKAALAQIKALRARQAEEEERLRQEEEERLRIEEEERKKKEAEEALLEGQRQKRREKEKARKLRQKAEGKLKTQAQRQRDAKSQAFLEQLQQQGVKLPDALSESKEGGAGDKSRKDKRRGRKKGGKFQEIRAQQEEDERLNRIRAEEEQKRKEEIEAERKRKAEAEAKAKQEAEEQERKRLAELEAAQLAQAAAQQFAPENDWEALAEGSAPVMDDVKDAWDESSEDEEAEVPSKEEDNQEAEVVDTESKKAHKHKKDDGIRRHPHKHRIHSKDEADGEHEGAEVPKRSPSKKPSLTVDHGADLGDWDDEVSVDEDEVTSPPPMDDKDVDLSAVPPARAIGIDKAADAASDSDSDDEQSGSSSEYSSSDDESSDDEMTAAERAAEQKREEARQRRKERLVAALAARTKDNLRSPIGVILGHVDTGKTKLLDRIRNTDVQGGEAGGITQQIGATYFPLETINKLTDQLSWSADCKFNTPGLLIIDTPGHESFTNLRSRGSSLCDIAILVVDILHGIEPQTVESLGLLRKRKTPFVVALNKIDRCFDWVECPNQPIMDALAKQPKHTISEFNDRVSKTITLFAEQGLNAKLYYENEDMRKTVSLVPTSAVTGEGIPDLLALMLQLTQRHMSDRLMFIGSVQCTVLEVKVIEGLGTTIDVILSNGVLHEGDQFVVCGLNGPIVTTIRALLTPQPLKEMRVKTPYVHHKEVKAAQGIKICAQDLDKCVPGSALLVVEEEDDVEEVKEEVMQDLQSMLNETKKVSVGVFVQASTLGSLEALLQFLKDSNIPVAGINIGPVHKKDVMRASVMLEHRREYSIILAFDVKMDRDTKEFAEEMGVRVFQADIIYHLFDQFTEFQEMVRQQKRTDASDEAVFPCILRIIPEYVFNKKDPIIVGVDVVAGILKMGTPICVPSRDGIELGRVTSIELNHKPLQSARKGEAVSVRITPRAWDPQKMFGRHFDARDELCSKLTRNSIDLLKEHYKDDLTKEEWMVVVSLKKKLDIQ